MAHAALVKTDRQPDRSSMPAGCRYPVRSSGYRHGDGWVGGDPGHLLHGYARYPAHPAAPPPSPRNRHRQIHPHLVRPQQPQRFYLSGVPAEQTSTQSATVLAFETRLARASKAYEYVARDTELYRLACSRRPARSPLASSVVGQGPQHAALPPMAGHRASPVRADGRNRASAEDPASRLLFTNARGQMLPRYRVRYLLRRI